MTITNNAVQVTWPTAANSKTVAAGVTEISEVQTVTGADCPNVTLTLKADNSTTQASGDEIKFYVIKTAGDPDGTGGDEYDTVENYEYLATVDTYTPSADPSVKTVKFNIEGIVSWKLAAVSVASANSITVSAAGNELDLE